MYQTINLAPRDDADDDDDVQKNDLSLDSLTADHNEVSG